MTQKKATPKTEPTVAVTAEPVDPIAAQYTTGKWHGHPNYECGLCPFSTLSDDAMRHHVVQRHMRETGLLDRYGNALARVGG